MRLLSGIFICQGRRDKDPSPICRVINKTLYSKNEFKTKTRLSLDNPEHIDKVSLYKILRSKRLPDLLKGSVTASSSLIWIGLNAFSGVGRLMVTLRHTNACCETPVLVMKLIYLAALKINTMSWTLKELTLGYVQHSLQFINARSAILLTLILMHQGAVASIDTIYAKQMNRYSFMCCNRSVEEGSHSRKRSPYNVNG